MKTLICDRCGCTKETKESLHEIGWTWIDQKIQCPRCGGNFRTQNGMKPTIEQSQNA